MLLISQWKEFMSGSASNLLAIAVWFCWILSAEKTKVEAGTRWSGDCLASGFTAGGFPF